MNKSCWTFFPNFKPEEFGCKCGCTPEVIDMDCKLLFILQAVRNYYGKPLVITSGYRCQKHNDSLTGSIPNSYHIKKKAADFYILGVTDTQAKREKIIELMRHHVGFKYAYHNVNGNHPNMGIAIHVEVY